MKKNYSNVYFKVLEENFPYFYAFIEPYDLKGMEELFDEVMVCFESEYWTAEIEAEILEDFKQYIPEIAITRIDVIEDKNWNEEIEKNTPTIIVSERIGIAPEWKKDEIDSEIKIIINPKMSFGTGQHSTTKLVAQLMENVVKKDEFWIDAGTGTGLLAILAMKLGAREVFAFDNDEWSINNAIENFELNGINDSFRIENIDMLNTQLPEANGIIANMFVNILDKTFGVFHKSLVNNKGSLILSGILVYDADYIIDLYMKNGFDLINKANELEWVALEFKVREIL